MSDERRLRRRALRGPDPWRPADEPVWLLRELGAPDEDEVGELPDGLAAELRERVSGLDTTFSVVMPTWNRAHSIERAIDSALAQTYGPTEIIVVDDGSTDGTPAMLHERYEQEIAAGTLVVVELDHEGVCGARNAGLARARGEIIAYLDSDNAWLPDYLAMVVTVFSDDDTVHTLYAGLRGFSHGVEDFKRAKSFDRRRLLHNNYIDLNVFAHRREVYERLGGFDPGLKRLVDWDLILRYTAQYAPAFVPAIGVDYHLNERELANITFSESFGDNYDKIAAKHAADRRQVGADELRIAYVAWDWPALSQTFFHREVQLLVDAGYDVNVYWHTVPDAVAEIDPRVDSYFVEDADHLARLLVEHERNVAHSHFIHPATSLLTYPACVAAGVPYTFMPHAVDLFQHTNRRRNKLAEVANHPLCLRVFVYGDHHADFLVGEGVDPGKISYMFQAVDFDVAPAVMRRTRVELGRPAVGVVIARFIEKKGITHLLDAMTKLHPDRVRIRIVGYGPLEKQLRKQAADLGLDHVSFEGPVTGEDELVELYRTSDFLVVPSVVASNGDMDGFPTVILEAMAEGLPVVTTDVSSVPDYVNDEVEAIVVPSADAPALADGIRRLLDMDPRELAALTRNAAKLIERSVGTLRTVHHLLDHWQAYTVDIVLVTFDREGYRSEQETLELIRRIRELTTTRYRLIIVDNASDPDVVDRVLAATDGIENVTLISKDENVFCGPASNVALRAGWSELAIYLCSKEAFPLRRGWERSFIDHFRDHPDAVLAGQVVPVPRSVSGEQMAAREDFERFREPDFAGDHPHRFFRHVQGGLYAVKRSFVAEEAEFNEAIPHGGMDIELSYVTEALGHELTVLPDVVALTNKTLPTPLAHLDSSSSSVHPLTCEQLAALDHLRDPNARACNHCGWVGDVRSSIAARRYRQFGCPSCGASALARLLLRVLANDPRVHSGTPLHAITFDPSLETVLGARMFHVTTHEPTPQSMQRLRGELGRGPAVVVLDGNGPTDHVARLIAESCVEALPPRSALVAPLHALDEVRHRPDVDPITEITLADRLIQFGLARYGQVEVVDASREVAPVRSGGRSRLASLLGR